MAQKPAIPSNSTELRWHEETSFGVADGSAIWRKLEPNSYGDFGGEVATVARSPIDVARQRQKGVVTDVTAQGSFNVDLTQESLPELAEGFFMADLYRKNEMSCATVSGTNTFEVASTEYLISLTQADIVFDSAADIDAGTEVFTENSHGLQTGDGPFQFTTSNTLPSGLALATDYYIIRVDANTLKLATSRANALAGTNLLIASTGTGNQTMSDVPGSTMRISHYKAGDLLFAQGFEDDANNGLHSVSSVTPTTVVVSSTLVNATTQTGTLRHVGYQFATADATIVVSGTWPQLVCTTKDLTELRLQAGEWVYIGDGSNAAYSFNAATENGWCRIRTAPTATVLEFDKASATMAANAGTGKTIRIFFASRVAKNEAALADQVIRTYQLERQLGAPDTDEPSEAQAEYLVGAFPATLQINIPTAEKLTADLSFQCKDQETKTADEGLKAGTRPDLTRSEALNSSSNVKRLRLYQLAEGSEYPTALFTYMREMNLTLDNQPQMSKAVGVTGSFDVVPGELMVSGSGQAYFENVDQFDAVRDNASCTLDFIAVKANQAFNLDLPLVTLKDGRANVEKDNSIFTAVGIEAASGELWNEEMNYTILMGWWDYVPDVAE